MASLGSLVLMDAPLRDRLVGTMLQALSLPLFLMFGLT